MKELGEKVPAELKDKVEAKLKELQDAVAGGNTDSIKASMEALNQEVMAMGQAVYSQVRPPLFAPAPHPPPCVAASTASAPGKQGRWHQPAHSLNEQLSLSGLLFGAGHVFPVGPVGYGPARLRAPPLLPTAAAG